MASTLTYLDSYCERAGSAALLAEPANAITNLFFIAGALVAFYLIARLPPASKPGERTDLWLLATCLFAIGVGSGLWHLMPNGTTVLMDVIPITLFINLYLISAMRRLLGFGWLQTGAWWAVYCVLTVAAQVMLPPDALNGTVMYLPTYLTLIVLTVAVATRNGYLGRMFMTMVLLWTISLIFRTFDQEWCQTLHMGTHFLWHTLNALMLYVLLTVLIRYRPPVAVPQI